MSILIPGKMPMNGEVIVIRPNGQATLYAAGDVVFLGDPRRIYKTIYTTIELPPHGRLIDADALDDMEIEYCDTHDSEILVQRVAGRNRIRKIVADAPTIIPADPEEGGSDG